MEGSHLVSIHSQAEYDFVLTYWRSARDEVKNLVSRKTFYLSEKTMDIIVRFAFEASSSNFKHLLYLTVVIMVTRNKPDMPKVRTLLQKPTLMQVF